MCLPCSSWPSRWRRQSCHRATAGQHRKSTAARHWVAHPALLVHFPGRSLPGWLLHSSAPPSVRQPCQHPCQTPPWPPLCCRRPVSILPGCGACWLCPCLHGRPKPPALRCSGRQPSSRRWLCTEHKRCRIDQHAPG